MWEFLLQIIQTLWNGVVLWFPAKVTLVQQGSVGVLFQNGRPKRVLEPGAHFATSGQEIKTLHTRRRVLQTEAIPIITADGVGLKVDVEAVTSVMDPIKFLTASEGADLIAAFALLSNTRSELQEATLREIVQDTDKLLVQVAANAEDTLAEDAGLLLLQLGVRSIAYENPVVAVIAASRGLYDALPEELQEDPTLAAMLLSPAALFTHAAKREEPLQEDVQAPEEVGAGDRQG